MPILLKLEALYMQQKRFCPFPRLNNCFYWFSECCILRVYIHKYKQKQSKIMTNFKEWTNTLLYKNIYLSHFILDSVGVSVVCKRWVETETNCYIDPTSSPDHSSSSSASWLGLLNRGSLKATTPSLQTGPYSGLLVSSSLNCRRHLPIFFHNTHLFPLLLPLIYTGASLIEGSVKDQYTTRTYVDKAKQSQARLSKYKNS